MSSATMQDPEAQKHERGQDGEQERQEQEQQGRDRARLDTILRTYAPNELELAREAIAAHPADKTSAINAVWVALGDMRKVRDLVDAVAEVDGAYEHASVAIQGNDLAASIQQAAESLAQAGALSPEQVGEAAKTLSRACAFEHPIVQEGMKLREDGPARRVLGRGLAELGEEIEQARQRQPEQQARQSDTGALEGTPIGLANMLLRDFEPLSPAAKRVAASLPRYLITGTDETGQPYGVELPAHDFHAEGVPPSPLDTDMEQLSASILRRSLGDSAGPFASRLPRPVPVLSASRERDKRDLFAFRYGQPAPVLFHSLGAVTQRAVDQFLGTGPARTQTLRGALRFLTQEDLATVMAECAVQIDDEHLQQMMRMLGPDDLQAVNWASAGEVSTRMLDAEVPQDFPVRPLTAEEHSEPVEFSTANGNPLLEKDVVQAFEVLEELAAEYAYPDEHHLAEELERRTGWNSIYAGEVAVEAWTRYYREEESK